MCLGVNSPCTSPSTWSSNGSYRRMNESFNLRANLKLLAPFFSAPFSLANMCMLSIIYGPAVATFCLAAACTQSQRCFSSALIDLNCCNYCNGLATAVPGAHAFVQKPLSALETDTRIIPSKLDRFSMSRDAYRRTVQSCKLEFLSRDRNTSQPLIMLAWLVQSEIKLTDLVLSIQLKDTLQAYQ